MTRAYGTGSIFEVGEGRWRAQKSVQTAKGRKYITGTGRSPGEAQSRLEANLTRWALRGTPEPKPKQKRTALIEAVWEYHRTHQVSPNADYRRERAIINHLEHRLEGWTVEEVTTQQLRGLMHSLATEALESTGQALGSTGRRGVFYTLKKTLDRAVEDDVIQRNPMSILKPPAIEVKQENHGLAERQNDYRKLWRWFLTTDQLSQGYIPMFERWIFAMWGLRQSERLGLTWDRFLNLENPAQNISVIISQQLYSDAKQGKVYIRKVVKTKRGERIIPLDAETSERFRRYFKAQQEQSKKTEWNVAHPGLVFTTSTGGFIRQSPDGQEWRALVKNVLPDAPHLKGHAARHLFASMLAEAGVQEHIASSLLGQSSAMVSYYTHVNQGQKAQALGEVGTKAMDLMINPEKYFPQMQNLGRV